MTGGVGIKPGTPSVIDLQIPKALIGDPAFVNVGVVSVGRGRVHSAGDIMGILGSIMDWNEPVTLETYAISEMTE